MNKLTIFRNKSMLSKAELARRAGISSVTIDRIEHGLACRIDTQRKILAALGLSVDDKELIFEEKK